MQMIDAADPTGTGRTQAPIWAYFIKVCLEPFNEDVEEISVDQGNFFLIGLNFFF